MDEYSLQEMRDFLRLHLGDDWELRLILADAIAGPFASEEDVAAAQQRAIGVVRTHSPGWNDNMSDLVAQAWLTLWMAS